MADVRAQLEEDERASLMMQAMRGSNMNDDDRQLDGVRMQVVEMRAGERGLPTTYEPETLAAYFGERPGAVEKLGDRHRALLGAQRVHGAEDAVAVEAGDHADLVHVHAA